MKSRSFLKNKFIYFYKIWCFLSFVNLYTSIKNYCHLFLKVLEKYPIRKGQKIGKINVYDNGRIVSSSDLIIDSSIDKISFIKFFVNNYLDSMSGVMY